MYLALPGDEGMPFLCRVVKTATENTMISVKCRWIKQRGAVKRADNERAHCSAFSKSITSVDIPEARYVDRTRDSL